MTKMPPYAGTPERKGTVTKGPGWDRVWMEQKGQDVVIRRRGSIF